MQSSNPKEKKKEHFPTRTRMVLHFLRGSKRWFALSITAACLVSLFDLVNPKIIQYTVDSVIGSEPLDVPGWLADRLEGFGGISYLHDHLWVAAVFVLGFAILGALFRYFFNLFNACGAETLVKTMRDEIFGHITELPFVWHSENHTGDIIQRCTSDVETIKVFVSEQLTSLFRVVLMIVLSLYFMLRINVTLALAEAFFIPVMVLGSLFFYTRIGTAFEKVDSEEGKLSSIAQENLTGVRVVRAFGREDYERQRFHKQNHGYTNLWYHLQKILVTFWVSGNMIANARDLTVTLLGAFLCVKGSMTAGEFIAFISYNALLAMPVRRLGRVISELSKAGISIDRIRYIMNAKEEIDDPDALCPDLLQDIVFEHVSWTYENGSRPVLEDINFTIKAGSTVGILGSTGSGKSTLMYLLDGLYELPETSGRITIGNTNIREINRKWLRSHIGMVLQEPFLFSRTLEENIAIAGDQSTEEILRATRIASLDGTIRRFTAGYQTFVGERGVTLSGGQKQRTAIAQMLVRRPPIMIFDDSLSAVDSETDARIQNALQEEIADVTTILIAHRITTLMNADQIIVMDQGKLVQMGTHEELLAQDGLYKTTYELQTRGEEVNAG